MPIANHQKFRSFMLHIHLTKNAKLTDYWLHSDRFRCRLLFPFGLLDQPQRLQEKMELL
jgi:hypothetical protein